MLKQRILVLILPVIALLAPVFAAEQKGDSAVVTLVEGTAQAFAPGAAKAVVLRKKDKLTKDHEVRVGEKSRLEIRFPDGTIMRLAEKSVLKLRDVAYSKQSGSKSLKVGLSAGKLWANVRKLMTPDSAVEVKTVNAVAGVRGTVYRVNVEEDASTVIKVYDGTVSVSGVPREVPKPASEVSGPVPVPGPHEVAPSYHEVSREEWMEIVQAMQQIRVSPDGTASKPQSFIPQDDRDEWVLWNQERDKNVSF